jgi:hypothetical protein
MFQGRILYPANANHAHIRIMHEAMQLEWKKRVLWVIGIPGSNPIPGQVILILG